MEFFAKNNSHPKVGATRWWEYLVVLLLVILELCWLIPWFRTVLEFRVILSIPEIALILGSIMMVSYGFAHWLGENAGSLAVQQLGIGLVLLVGLWIAERTLLDQGGASVFAFLLNLEPGAVLVFFTVLWLWWRGVGLARDMIHPNIVWQRFQFALFMFMAYLLVSDRLQTSDLGFAWFVFILFVGFLSVIYARVSYVGILKGVLKNPFDRRWLVFSSIFLALLIFFAAILSSLLTGQYHVILEFTIQTLKLIVALFLFMVALPSLIVSIIISPIIPWLQQLIGDRTVEQTPAEMELGAYPMFQNIPAPQPVPVQVQGILFWGLILIILALVFVRIRKVRKQAAAQTSLGPESLLDKGEAGAILRKAFHDTLDALAARVRPFQRQLAAAHVRRIYAELMDLFQELGRPRPLSRTPLEFLPAMKELLPAVREELELITQAYTRVRYGDYPESLAEIDHVDIAWQRVLEDGKRLKKSGWHNLDLADE
ncbi:MAG TPA: DUF4129 domain-containing protein [Anaerolineales bacterium]|nr:DUF4129 domain-containing protein [Anaerolineales bacterium]